MVTQKEKDKRRKEQVKRRRQREQEGLKNPRPLPPKNAGNKEKYREMKIGVIARVPLDEGSLGGKLTPETKFPKDDWRAGYFSGPKLRTTLKRIDRLKAILPDGMSLPEMALRFILSNPVVSTLIIGMRKVEHVRQNLAVSEAGALDAELLEELKKHRWDRKPTKWSQ